MTGDLDIAVITSRTPSMWEMPFEQNPNGIVDAYLAELRNIDCALLLGPRHETVRVRIDIDRNCIAQQSVQVIPW